jgi:hypothetical protein
MNITDQMRQELNHRLALLTAIVWEKQAMEKSIQETLKNAQETFRQKKHMEEMKAARGKAHSSIATDLEFILAKFLICHALYHGGDFNGICFWGLVHNATEIILDIKPILAAKKDDGCEERVIEEKMERVENTLGLVDAAFLYLNILYQSEDEEQKA